MGRGRCPSEEASRSSHPHRAPRCPADNPCRQIRRSVLRNLCHHPAVLDQHAGALRSCCRGGINKRRDRHHREICGGTPGGLTGRWSGAECPRLGGVGPSSAFIGFGPKNHHIGPVYGQGCQPLPDRREGIVDQITPSISHFDAIDLAQMTSISASIAQSGPWARPTTDLSRCQRSRREEARAGSMACQTRNPCSREPSVEA